MYRLIIALSFVFAFTLLPVSTDAATLKTATRVEENSVWYRLYLGTGITAPVSAEQMQRFLETAIAPKFPSGFTVLEAQGQWSSREHGIIKEKTMVLDLQAPDSEDAWQVVRAIGEEYVRQFAAAKASIYIKRIPGVTATLFYLP